MKLGLALAAASLLAATALAAPVQSGRQPGEEMTPFDVVDVTGPNKSKQLCYV